MNNNNGAISFKALLDTRDFEQGRFKIESQLRDITKIADQEAAKFDHIFKRTGQAMAAYFTFDAARQLVGDIVKVRGEFQQLEIAFTTMLGSKAKADGFMREMVDFAATTPFDLSSTASAAKQLLAYGSAAQDVRKEMTMLGDVAAGLSVPIGDLVYLYGTLRTQGRAYAVDIRQFAGRGIPIYEELAKVMKINKDEVSSFVEQGKVGFKEVEMAFQNMTAAGSMFGGMMEAQSQSIPGRIERLKDAWDQMLNTIGKDNEGIINGAIGSLANLVEHYDDVGRILAGLVATYGTYKAALAISSAITNSHAEIVARETAVKLANIDATIAERTAVLSSIEAKAADALATENQYRAELQLMAEKEAVAIATVQSATATEAEAMAKYKAALASNDISRKHRIEVALKELSIATTAKNTAVTNAESLSRDVNTRTVLLNNQSKATNTLATEVNTAANNLSALSAQRAAVARAAETTAISAMTGRQVLATIATKAQATAQSFLNATMLANPYVAVTAAVVGLGVAIWALHDDTNSYEKAQTALNEKLEETKQKKDNLSNSASSLISVIKDETKSIYDQIRAYEELILKLPELQKFSRVDIQSMDGKELSKLVNESISSQEIKQQAKDLEYFKKMLVAVKSEMENRTDFKASDEIKASVKELDSWKTSYEDIEAYLKTSIAHLERQKGIQAEAARLEEARANGKEAEITYLQNIKSKLEDQKRQLQTVLLTANQTGKSFNTWQQYLDAISLQGVINQLKQVDGALLRLGVGAPGSGVALDYTYWKNQQEEAQANMQKNGILPGTAEFKEYAKSYAEATEKLKQWDTTVKKTRTKKPEEKFLEGSIKYFDQQIQKLQDKLERLPVNEANASAIEELQDKILSLTKARAEAQKAIEVRTWQETIDEKLKMYIEYEEALRLAEEKDFNNLKGATSKQLTTSDGSVIEVFDADSMKSQLSYVNQINAAYSKILESGQSRIEFLKSEKQKIEELVASGKANSEQVAKLIFLESELAKAEGKSSPLEKYKEKIDNISDSAHTYSKILDELNMQMEELNTAPDALKSSTDHIEKVRMVREAIRDITKRSADELRSYLESVAGSEAKRAAVVLKYQRLIEAAREKGVETLGLERELNEELAKIETEKADAQRGAASIMQASTLKELKGEEARIREKIKILEEKGLANTEEAVRLQKQLGTNLNEQADKTYQNLMLWHQAIGSAGSELSQLEGTLGNIGQLFSSAAQSAQQFASTYANMTDGNKSNDGQGYAAAAQAGVNLIALVIGAAQRRKAKRKQEQANTLQVQLDLNKALVEEIRLRTELSENVYVTNYYDRIRDSIDAMAVASDKAFGSLLALSMMGKAKNGTKNKIDWGAVGSGAGGGATIGALVGAEFFGVGAIIGAVVGAIAGGLVGLFGAMKKDSRYSGIFEVYPELIDQSGQLNQSLAETLIANDQLDAKTKQYLQSLIDMNAEWQAARDQIKEVVGELTGQMGNELRDALVGAFEEGKDAARDFADVVEDTLQNALEQLIYSKVFGGLFDTLGSDMENALMYYGMTNDLAGVYDAMAKFMANSQESIDIFNKVMEAAQEYGKNYGFELWDNVDSRAEGMAGQIKGITEETANVLAGNITQMRIKQAEHTDLFRQQLFHLANISSNSDFLPMLSKLEYIERHLSKMANGSSARDFGGQY